MNGVWWLFRRTRRPRQIDGRMRHLAAAGCDGGHVGNATAAPPPSPGQLLVPQDAAQTACFRASPPTLLSPHPSIVHPSTHALSVSDKPQPGRDETLLIDRQLTREESQQRPMGERGPGISSPAVRLGLPGLTTRKSKPTNQASPPRRCLSSPWSSYWLLMAAGVPKNGRRSGSRPPPPPCNERHKLWWRNVNQVRQETDEGTQRCNAEEKAKARSPTTTNSSVGAARALAAAGPEILPPPRINE